MGTADDQIDRLPPHDPHAELAALGSVFLDNRALPVLRAHLDAGDFYSPDHRTIFEAMCAVAGGGGHVDYVTVADELKAAGDLERVGGPAYLIGLCEGTPSAARAEDFARIVARHARRRRIMHTCNVAAQMQGDDTATEEERARALAEVLDAAACRGPAFDLDAAVDATLAEVDAATDPDGGGRLLTGIESLDCNIGGIQRGHVWVLGGRTQHGKTATAVNITEAVVCGGHAVLWCLYDGRRSDVLMRLASLRSGVPYGEVRAGGGGLNPDELGLFRQTLDGFRTDLEGRLSALEFPTLAQIEREAQRLRPALVVVDTVQKATHAVGRSRTDRHDLEVARLTAWLGRLAGRYDLAVLALSQIGRSMFKSGQKGLPRLEHLKESGAIEEDADVVVLVYWPLKQMLLGLDTPADRYVLDLAKNRHAGFTGVMAASIDPGTQRLAGLSREDEDAFIAEVLAASGG